MARTREMWVRLTEAQVAVLEHAAASVVDRVLPTLSDGERRTLGRASTRLTEYRQAGMVDPPEVAAASLAADTRPVIVEVGEVDANVMTPGSALKDFAFPTGGYGLAFHPDGGPARFVVVGDAYELRTFVESVSANVAVFVPKSSPVTPDWPFNG